MANRHNVKGGAADPVYIMGVEDTANMPVSFTAADWAPILIADETINDSDKTITVPPATQYHFLSVWVEYASTATVGDRQIVVEFQDASSDVIGQVRAGAVQAASVTRYYMFSPPCADLGEMRDTDFLMSPLPFWVAAPGWKLRVYDNNAVAAAADDMVIQVVVAARSV